MGLAAVIRTVDPAEAQLLSSSLSGYSHAAAGRQKEVLLCLL